MAGKELEDQTKNLLEDEALSGDSSDDDLQEMGTGGSRKIFFQIYIFILTFFTYATLHISRESWSFLKEKVKEKESPGIGLSSDDLGTIDMFFFFIYSIGIFISGILGDNLNKNLLIGCGYLITCAASIMIGLGGLWDIRSVWYYVGFFSLNGIGQSVGWPSVIAIMANWFPKKGRGFWFGVWAANPNVGNILGTLICSLTNDQFGLEWSWTWIIVAIIVGVFGIINFIFMIEHPDKVGIIIHDEQEEREAMLEQEQRPNTSEEENINLTQRNGDSTIDGNQSPNNDGLDKAAPPNINFFRAWCVPGVIQYSICYLCLKLCNYGIMLWLPTYVSEELLFTPSQKALIAILYDIGTITGSISLGFLTDMLYGKRIPICYVSLLIATVFHSFLIFLCSSQKVLIFIVIFILGFFIGSISNMVASTACADIGKHASIKGNESALSTVTGIVDGTGSLGAAAGQKGIGYIQDHASWTAVFIMMTSFVFTSSIPISCIFIREIKEIINLRRVAKEEKFKTIK